MTQKLVTFKKLQEFRNKVENICIRVLKHLDQYWDGEYLEKIHGILIENSIVPHLNAPRTLR